MTHEIIPSLNAQLESTNYFEQLFELCELVKDGEGKISPKQYCQNGEWKEVSNFDRYNGIGYWRKNGDTIIREEQQETFRGCEIALLFSYPLKFIACVPKEKLDIDDAYSDERMGAAIVRVLTTKSKDLKQTLGAKRVSVIPVRATTDNQSILNTEYSGIEITDINYKYAYLSLDVEVNVLINKDCLQDQCTTYPYPT